MKEYEEAHKIIQEEFQPETLAEWNASRLGVATHRGQTYWESLLEAKINMFELVVGEIDMILGNWGEEEDFEQTVAGLWSEADDEDEFRQRMEELGERLRRARQDYLTQQAHDDRLFGDAFQP